MGRKFLVATIVCDGTGSRAGIVEAKNEREAMMRFGFDIIRHPLYPNPAEDEYDWREYVEEHDSVIGQSYFLDAGDEPIPMWKLYHNRAETGFHRWMMLVPMSEELLKKDFVMIGYERESSNPRMWFASNEEAAYIEVSKDLFVEYFIYIDGQLVDSDTPLSELSEASFKI